MSARRAALLVAALCACGTAALAAQTDPSGAWRTWTTPHFRIHARAGRDSAALHLAREAERSWRLLSSELVPPHGRVDIALLDNVDFSNGLTNVFPSNRIILYLDSPAGDISLGRYDDWLRLVTTHELTHVFHLDRAGGVWNVLRHVFGRAPGLFPNTYTPSWVSEGIAVYYESHFTTAGRERGAFDNQMLAALAPSSRWPESGDATFVSPKWPAGDRPYVWGGRFFQEEANLHGDSVIPRFVARTSRQLWPYALSGPLEGAGGESVGAIWGKMRARWRGRGGPEGHLMVRGLRGEPQVCVGTGSRVAYVAGDGRSISRLTVMDATSGRILARHAVNGAVTCAWVGDTVYVAQLDFDSPVTIRSDLYRWTPGGAWDRVTHGARVQYPFALPAGELGVIVAAHGTHDVRTIDRRTGALQTLPTPPADDWARIAASPDGRWLAGARHLGGRWDIVAWPRADPTAAIAVTDDATLDGDPAWAGNHALLFVSERTGMPQIYRYTLGAGAVERLTDEPTGAREPHVLPDGTLLYATMQADGYALARLDHPASVGAEPADSVVPFTPAPAVPVRVGGYDPWPALVPRYWLPAGHTESGAGDFVGAVTSASDVIGRTAYYAYAAVSPSPFRWEAELFVTHRRWRSFGLDADAWQAWDYAGRVRLPDSTLRPVGHRERVATAGLTWYGRRWRSAEAVRLGTEVGQDAYEASPAVTGLPGPWSYVGGVLSASAARVEQPALAISAENGFALSGIARSRQSLNGAGSSYELLGSSSLYLGLPLPGFSHWVLAANVRGGRSGGPNGPLFGIGGETSQAFSVVPGLTLGGSRRSFPLRGYPGTGSAYERAVSATVELRIPLLLVGRGIWELPMSIDRISASLFAETGGGWNAGDPVRPTAYRDVGAEAVFDLGVAYDQRLRVRAGVAVPLTDGLGVQRGDLRGYVAIGPSF